MNAGIARRRRPTAPFAASMIRARTGGSVAVLFVLAACSPSAPAPEPQQASPARTIAAEGSESVERHGVRIAIRWVWPRATDPAIDSAIEPHFVALAAGAPRRGTLFLYLPGTLGRADEARHLTELAAAAGLHAIGLRYPNEVAVQQLCASDPDTTCFERARLEVITGEDRHDRLSIRPADSILNRVDQLLRYLAARHSAEGWEQYVRDGRADWGRIVVAGTSQGGGMAAMIARDRLVARVAMLASPVESFSAGGRRHAAPWTAHPHVTPSERYYGFGHVQDPFGLDVMIEGWSALGLPGPAVDVGSVSPPFNGSHQLTTAAISGGASQHPTPARPLTDAAGSLAFRRVWEHMFGID